MRKSVSKGLRGALGALLAGVCATVFAHHSFSMFDMKTTKTLSGTVKEFEWTNPHTWLWLMVPNDRGELEQWGIEGMSPNFLGRRGWSKHTLRPGDKVTVEIHPLRNGEHGGTFLNVTLPSGKKLMMFGAQIEDAKAEDGKPADSTKPY
ncbi:MAG TPA: DUF6152 family protein [Steroidobacteraceae bacterium]|jgi:hypothetical protein|nr:DUF6152 family protein [Steroidobacteraceae bacterium]